MLEEKKIRSLVRLLDDTDAMIFNRVRSEILNQGDAIIPLLEEFWEQNSFDAEIQERIEHLIHEIQFLDIERRIGHCSDPDYPLLEGLYAISKYQYPDLRYEDIHEQISVFANQLEANIYPNARIKDKLAIVNEFFYNKWGFRGNKQNLSSPQNSFISDVLSTRKGNPLLLSSVYYILCDWIGLPVVPINFPRYFILGVYNPDSAPTQYPDYFLDIFGRGTVLSEYDLRKYLNSINLEFDARYLLPCKHIDMVKRCFNNLLQAYENLGYNEKMEEINHLSKLLDN